MERYDYLVKLIIIGDSGVGKSTIMSMYCDDTFMENYVSTIGVDFKVKIIDVNDKIAKVQIWDTAGQERFKSITRSYYKDANGVLLVFDLTNRQSFIKLEQWINEI